MASNNRLYRNFVILQEDERGYSNSSDKSLSGYSKIEAKGDKCKISFYAQNLKKDNDNYYMMLICCKKDIKQIINLGPIEVSDTGKAEVTKEYNVSNIGGLDIQFDKISGTAIAKFKDGIPVFVMCGFLNGQQPTENWKNYTIVKAKEIKIRATEKVAEKEHKKEPRKPEIKVKESKEKSIGDTVIEEAKVTVVEEVKEDITSEEIERSEEKLIDNDEGKVTKEEYYKRENLRGKFEDYEDEIEDSKEFNPTTGKIRGSIGEYFETIVDGFDRDYDSIDELKYTKWYKIPVHDLHEMCNMSDYNKYTLAYYPMLNYYPYIKKHGYFMIGYKCDSQGNLKHIIYAIPGKKDKDEQPYDGRTGFVTWVNLNGKDNEGCWLMFYDFKNSTVVVPMQ
ncbi:MULTISPECIES: hypothetical protein [unclassified Clostridium]|jgi:hypothetical protein|uniref:DUF7922 domain-containing protein n=1 Tax=Clostridium TaxID=1485 RepID=UPI001C8CC647|nr:MULTISPECIES: hypothetical protein [unclassified Clostridium]MBX9137342.1 hypothetical protein [Clostridium sp. K12(2020)]MBX9144153.1 hypothetical protein [Clostridium sp. K13]MDU2290825.1 hypothetical protein [Clostridium celatum]MDU4324605.1 hypothetical protein [Clostridium celatum]